MATPGLRERKKEAVRQAMSDAAIRFALAEGLENVSVERIAEAAGVSPRTFHNYFSSKEDAVLDAVHREARRLASDLRSRPPGEDIWDSLEALAVAATQRPPGERSDMGATTRLAESHPSLRARRLALVDETDRAVIAVIAERTGTDADADLYPRLLHMAAAGALRAAIDLSLTSGADTPSVEHLVRDAFAQLRAGLPPPTPAHGSTSRP